MKTLKLCGNIWSWHPSWVNDCSLAPNEQFVSYIIERTSCIRWDDNDVRFGLDQNS